MCAIGRINSFGLCVYLCDGKNVVSDAFSGIEIESVNMYSIYRAEYCMLYQWWFSSVQDDEQKLGEKYLKIFIINFYINYTLISFLYAILSSLIFIEIFF